MENRAKKFNKKGKKFTSIFVKKFFISLFSLIVSSIVFISLFMNSFWNFMTEKFYDDRKIAIHGAKVLPNSYDDLDYEMVLSNNGWIEILENNEVVDVIGNKSDDEVKYSKNLIEYMYEHGKSYPSKSKVERDNDYSIKVYYEDMNHTYLVKIKNWDAILLDYVEEMLVLDVKDKEFKEFIQISIEVILIPLIVALICFVTIIALHIYFAIRTIKEPIALIQHGIDEFGNGNMDAKIDFYSYIEFNNIKDNFNYMIDKIDKAEKERIKLEESKKKMIRDISHDIKTPITSILGYSKAIIDKEEMTDDERDIYLGYIYNKTVRIDYLINELFKFVELDSSNYQLNKVNKDYIEFIREVVLLHYKDIENKGFNLDLDLGEEEILLDFDDKNMERAISNLIVNAIKYNLEDTILKISVKEAKNNIITVIEDDGIGIEEEVLSTIFEEFVRGDKSRNSKGGSGLGLAITKKIINLHNGSIRLESKIGEGSRFTIILPK